MEEKITKIDIIFILTFMGLNSITAQLVFSPWVNANLTPFPRSFISIFNSIISDMSVLIIVLVIGLFIFKRKSKLFLYLIITTVFLNVFMIAIYIYSIFFNEVFVFCFASMDQPSEGFIGSMVQFVIMRLFNDGIIFFLVPTVVLVVLNIFNTKGNNELISMFSLRKKITTGAISIAVLLLTIVFAFEQAKTNSKSALAPDLFSIHVGGLYSFYLQIPFRDESPRYNVVLDTEDVEELISKFNTSGSSDYHINPLTGQKYNRIDNQTNQFLDKNLFVIQIESFSNFLIGKNINGIYVTPFLNSLVNDHIYFSNVMQSIGFGNTNDAELSLLTGLFGKRDYIVLQDMAYGFENGIPILDVPTLPNMFRERNFKTFYFHGEAGEFYDRNVTHELIGFESIHFQQEFIYWSDYDSFDELPKEYVDGNFPWISDRAMLNYALYQINDFLTSSNENNQTNFFAHSVLVQPHIPFQSSDNLPTIDWGPDVNRTDLNNYLNRIHYIDGVLEEFMTQAKEKLDNTIFILYSDHGPVIRSAEFRNLINANSAIEETLNIFSVPVFFVDNTSDDRLITTLNKDKAFEKNLDLTRSQRDLFRTIVNMWGLWDYANYVFGVNMFTSEPSIAFESRIGYFQTGEVFTSFRNVNRNIKFNDISLISSELEEIRDNVLMFKRMNNHFINTRRSIR